MRIRIQRKVYRTLKQKLPVLYEEFSEVEKNIKDSSKVKTIERVQIYLKHLNKITVITNFLEFFSVFM